MPSISNPDFSEFDCNISDLRVLLSANVLFFRSKMLLIMSLFPTYVLVFTIYIKIMVNSFTMAEEEKYNTENDKHERGLLGSVIGGLALGPVGAVIGDKIQNDISDDDKKEEEQQKPQKKKGGSCSGNSSSDSSSSCNNPIGE